MIVSFENTARAHSGVSAPVTSGLAATGMLTPNHIYCIQTPIRPLLYKIEFCWLNIQWFIGWHGDVRVIAMTIRINLNLLDHGIKFPEINS